MRRNHELAATTGSVSWTIAEGDEFDVAVLALRFDSAPTTSENITLTIDSSLGSEYDTVFRVIDPSVTGATDIVVENLTLFAGGDKLLVTYANTDGNSITGHAVTEL